MVRKVGESQDPSRDQQQAENLEGHSRNLWQNLQNYNKFPYFFVIFRFLLHTTLKIFESWRQFFLVADPLRSL